MVRHVLRTWDYCIYSIYGVNNYNATFVGRIFMLQSLRRIFRELYIIRRSVEVTLSASISGRLKYFVSSGLNGGQSITTSYL